MQDRPPPHDGSAATAKAAPRAVWRRFVTALVALSLIWGGLTGFRLDTLYFGAPAVLLGAGLVFVIPPAPGWRLSPRGAIVFAMWFAVQSFRGAVDVSVRAFSPEMPLRPGFRRYRPALPAGAPRVMFLNTITLLPGTLSAEVEDESEGQTGTGAVIVHMLDTRADLQADMRALEARIAALFALDPALYPRQEAAE